MMSQRRCPQPVTPQGNRGHLVCTMSGMTKLPHNVEPAKAPQKPPAKPAGKDKANAEALREQARTETEARPYLDTEGGE